MTTFLIIIHVIACLILIGLVLIQRGRGAGLVESFAGVESMFGTKTSAFLTRTTTIMSIVFFITCLSLAVLSVKQSKSLMRNVRAQTAAQKTEAASQASKPQETVLPKSESQDAAKTAPAATATQTAEPAKPDAAKTQ